MHETHERLLTAVDTPTAAAATVTNITERVADRERWKAVAHIIGADHLAIEPAALDLAGEAWAEERFGAEARCFVKVFDALTAMAAGTDASDVHSSDTDEDRKAKALTGAWDRAFAHARQEGMSRVEAREFADEYTAFVEDQWGVTRDPDVPIPSPSEYVR